MSRNLHITLFLSGQWNMRVRSRIARRGTRVKDEQRSNIAVESHRGEHYRPWRELDGDGAWQEEVET